MATSALVVIAVVLIGLWDLRRQAASDRETQVNEARALALTLRAVLERGGVKSALSDGAEFGRALSEAQLGWTVRVHSTAGEIENLDLRRRIATIKNAASTRASTLASMVDEPTMLVTQGEDSLTFTVPLRIPNPDAARGFDVAGVLEVAASTANLNRRQESAAWRATAFLVIIGAIVFFAVLLFTRGVITRPIKKLLAGVDDVARGDLSHTVLSEREDEIGKLASRFNEMTFSLRESQAETARQNQARSGLEERLFQTEKMATIGQLAAEIAHEVGTPLNVISGRARTLGKKASDTEAVVKNAGIIAEQSQRITRIIQRLLDFARRRIGHVETELVDMGQIAATTLEFLEGRLRSAKVEPTLDVPDDLPLLRGQPDQLQQVLLNLIINATEAMPGGGSLIVEAGEQTRRRPGLADAAPETVVVVSVSDTGAGIPEEIRERIFEPFYTSKDREGGTGLGLAVSHGIVKEHDGWIEVDDGAHGGTSFSLFFPVAAVASNPPQPTSSEQV